MYLVVLLYTYTMHINIYKLVEIEQFEDLQFNQFNKAKKGDKEIE